MRAVIKSGLIAASVGALMAACATSANATPININFNFIPTSALSANTGKVTTATTITAGAPDIVTTIFQNNVGLVGFPSLSATQISLTSPTPVTKGATFTKTFTTADGTFVEDLKVTSVSVGATSLGIDATGTITETVVDSGSLLAPTPVTYSAAYTQNGGAGTTINASFNDATQVPEPLTLSLFGAGLVGAAALRRRKKA